MDWYEEWFGKEYMLVYPHRNEAEAKKQIEFLKGHIHLREGAKVLDLCCGCGRHAVELKVQGYDVVGLDLSEELSVCLYGCEYAYRLPQSQYNHS